MGRSSNKKAAILLTAAQHFSRYGYEGISLDAIAEEVGITKPAIYYHFKDKAGLYEAVLLERLQKLGDAIEEATGRGDPVEKLRSYIDTFGEFLQEHRCFAAILAHEFADNGAHMPESAVCELSRTLGRLTAILSEGREAGVFELNNPMQIQLMVVSTLIMHQTTRNLRHRALECLGDDRSASIEADMGSLASDLAQIVLRALASKENRV
ncbi:TetR/AcrR family transcriptional regulator [Nitratifractor sp.]